MAVTEYRLYVRPGTRGLYARRSVDGVREVTSLGTSDKKVALARIRELNGRAILTPYTADAIYGPNGSGMTVHDGHDRYMALTDEDPDLSPETKGARATQLANVERVLGPKTLLRELRREDVDRPELRETGRETAIRLESITKDERAKQIAAWSRGKPYTAIRLAEGVSAHTIHKELCQLRGMLNCCDRELVVPVTAIMPVKWSAGYVPSGKAMTLEQARALLDSLAPFRRGFVAFGLGTGARLSEIRRARPREDLDLDRGFIHLRGSKTKKAKRTVPFAPLVREFLDIALACLPEGKEQYDFWLNVNRDLPLAGRRALGDEPHVSPNTLRHTWATLLEETGLDRSLIAEMGGWTSTAMLDRVYGHRRPVASKALVDAYFAEAAPESGKKKTA